jgi:hypothetical protein
MSHRDWDKNWVLKHLDLKKAGMAELVVCPPTDIRRSVVWILVLNNNLVLVWD